jgi:hypothetical protein
VPGEKRIDDFERKLTLFYPETSGATFQAESLAYKSLGQRPRYIVNRFPRLKAWNITIPELNAPFKNKNLERAQIVQIIDPRHPLYGKSFPLLSISEHLSHRSLVSVKLDENTVLRIPLLSTNLSGNHFFPSCRISLCAVNELISIAKEYEFLCHVIPEMSGKDYLLNSKNSSAKTSQ